MSRFKILPELCVQDGEQKNCDILVNLDYIVHCVPGGYRLVSKPAALEYLNIGDDEERYKKTVKELKGTEIHLADGKEYILAYEFEEFCKMILKDE